MQSAPFPLSGPEARPPLLGDGAALRGLLALAGPALAPRLCQQIVADLAATRAQLAPALAAGDRAQIRAASHVLISVAGTIGATGVHAAALALNEAAHGQDAARVAALGPGLLADLAALVTLVPVVAAGGAE